MDDIADRFVSFALSRPARFGRENFAGDARIKDFVDVVLRSFSLDVRMYVSWECPPDVSVLGLPVGTALVRSERLDTLLVEFHRLQQVQPILESSLAQDVVEAQVYRWMCEFLVGYRDPPLALDALDLRPDLTGLDLKLWNPFRDETLASIPEIPKVALQCFSLAHELGHVWDRGEPATGLDTEVDGMAIISHLDHEIRASGATPAELRRFRAHCDDVIDIGQVVDEIRADVFGLECVAEYLFRVAGIPPDTAVRHTMAACEALIFVYHAKEICRLLARVSSGAEDLERYWELRDADRLEWVARARAIGRRAGITLTYLEDGTAADLDLNVGRIDAIITETAVGRRRTHAAIDACERALLGNALVRRDAASDRTEVERRLEDRPDLRLELFYLLIAFGCHGSVDPAEYLTNAGTPPNPCSR